MKSIPRRKLQLSLTTLRTLSERELVDAAGAGVDTNSYVIDYSCFCPKMTQYPPCCKATSAASGNMLCL